MDEEYTNDAIKLPSDDPSLKLSDVYIVEKIVDIQSYVNRASRRFRRYLETNLDSSMIFKSWRSILDMNNFSEFSNTKYFF